MTSAIPPLASTTSTPPRISRRNPNPVPIVVFRPTMRLAGELWRANPDPRRSDDNCFAAVALPDMPGIEI